MTEAAPRRRRDPEERRRTIVEAAATLITEVGSEGLTHRLVAKRAGVPLGSTTQYFATLDDLREAALARLADDIDSGLAEVAETLAEHGPAAAVFAETLHDYLSDERLIRADLALVSAAVLDPALRPLAAAGPTGWSRSSSRTSGRRPLARSPRTRTAWPCTHSSTGRRCPSTT